MRLNVYVLLLVALREAEGEAQRTFLFVAYGASLVIRERGGGGGGGGEQGRNE